MKLEKGTEKRLTMMKKKMKRETKRKRSKKTKIVRIRILNTEIEKESPLRIAIFC